MLHTDNDNLEYCLQLKIIHVHFIFNDLLQLASKGLLKIKFKDQPKQTFKTENKNKNVQKNFQVINAYIKILNY